MTDWPAYLTPPDQRELDRIEVALATAEPRELRENIGALVEVQEYIERMIERAAK